MGDAGGVIGDKELRAVNPKLIMPQPILRGGAMRMEMKWLTGLTVQQCEKMDYTWFFRFSEDATIATEAPWRLTGDRILATSEDDGHPSGLETPVDVAARVQESVRGREIAPWQIREQTQI